MRGFNAFMLAVLLTAPAAAVAYEVSPVTDGGTITGKVLFKGNPPEAKTL